jgi:hypothetical protein
MPTLNFPQHPAQRLARRDGASFSPGTSPDLWPAALSPCLFGRIRLRSEYTRDAQGRDPPWDIERFAGKEIVNVVPFPGSLT